VVSSRTRNTSKYDVVHNLVHEKLKADKKVARPKAASKSQVENFKRTGSLTSVFKEVKSNQKSLRECDSEDETRLGLRTVQRRKLTSELNL